MYPFTLVHIQYGAPDGHDSTTFALQAQPDGTWIPTSELTLYEECCVAELLSNHLDQLRCSDIIHIDYWIGRDTGNTMIVWPPTVNDWPRLVNSLRNYRKGDII